MSVFVCKRHFWWQQIMLQYRAEFSYILVHWRIRMIRTKNYETVSKFVKVMRRTVEYCGLFFSRTRCILNNLCYTNWLLAWLIKPKTHRGPITYDELIDTHKLHHCHCHIGNRTSACYILLSNATSRLSVPMNINRPIDDDWSWYYNVRNCDVQLYTKSIWLFEIPYRHEQCLQDTAHWRFATRMRYR